MAITPFQEQEQAADFLPRHRFAHRLSFFLALLLILSCLLSLASGAVDIRLTDILQSIRHPHSLSETQQLILWQVRLPRILLALLVGATLALAGCCLQALFRNPLAEPGLIGVSGGSALAAVMTIVILGPWLDALFPGYQTYILPCASFFGGLLVTFLVYRFAQGQGAYYDHLSRLLLAGIALNIICNAGMGLLIYLANDQQLRGLSFWNLGSFANSHWSLLNIAAPIMVLVIILLPRFGQSLNALLLGEDEAGHLGFAVKSIKVQLIILITLGVGAAVALCGVIAFIGLVVPHLLRLVIGPNHRILLPASALLGALLLVNADLLARTLVAPAELPVGIITTLIGGPIFLYLIIRQPRTGARL